MFSTMSASRTALPVSAHTCPAFELRAVPAAHATRLDSDGNPNLTIRPAEGRTTSRLRAACLSFLAVFAYPSQTGAQTGPHPDDNALRIGVYENPPKIFTSADGTPSGLFVDLIKAITEREGLQLQFISCQWQICLQQLQKGELDLMPDVALTEERRLQFDFHQIPALHSWSQLFRHEAAAVESIVDLDGKRIAMLESGVQEASLRAMTRGFDIDFEIVPATSIEEAFLLTARGAADVAVGNHLFGAFSAPDYGLLETPVVFQPVQLYFAAAPDLRHRIVLERIDAHLEVWKRDPASPYFEIIKRWTGQQPELPGVVISRPLVNALLASLAFVALLSAGLIILRSQVNRRTRELSLVNRQIAESEQKYRELAESINDVIWTLDPETLRFLYVSPSVFRLRGYTPEEIMAEPMDAALTPESAARVHAQLATNMAAFEAGQRTPEDYSVTEVEQPCKNGGSVWTEVVTNMVRNPRTGKLEIHGVTRDISERKRAEAEIQRLARFDHLTGLPNRSLLKDRFNYALSLAQRNHSPLAVMFLDLDHFKHINDTLGHDVGDRLLIEVARRLEADLRTGDTVCRLGGDEFVFLLPDTDAEGATRVASKLLDTVARPFTVGTHELSISPSIGIAMYPDDGNDMESLSRNADAAMYQVKRESRNAYRFFTAEMQAYSTRALLLTNAMRSALDHGQFTLHYQPQISLHSGKVIGAEALLRWTHPDLGPVSPAEFIPVAESSGLIMAIGRWVMETAVGQARRWHEQGLPPLLLSINLSAAQFRDPDLPALASRIIAESGLPPWRFGLELTESVAMENPQAAIRTMDALAAHGVQLSIDDFGTGYSSLSYLKRFKVGKLKIDQSFVRDITCDPDDRAIVIAIIQLAHSLGLGTIAEGVETAEQLALLREQGCEAVQGYLLSHPLDAQAFEAFLLRARPHSPASA